METIFEPTEDEVLDALHWSNSMARRNQANDLICRGLNDRQLDVIEGIWATTLSSWPKLTVLFKEWGIDNAEVKAKAYEWIRHGPFAPQN